MLAYYIEKTKNMEMENAAFSVKDLEKRTYRYLQQLAKSLKLPSNVKKIHLIHLIYAKKFKSENEVDSIIQKVKEERKQQALNRLLNKKNLQNREISSTSLLQSPPITRTPRRPVHAVLRYSPDFNPFKSNSRHSLSNMNRSIGNSDRVLRSFNQKALRKSYGAVNVCNSYVNQSKPQSPRKVHSIHQVTSLPNLNFASKHIDARHRSSILNANTCLAPRNVNPIRNLLAQSEERPKRQRTISGIYPLKPKEIPHRTFDSIRSVSLRHTDGRLSTISALVQKRNPAPSKPPPKRNKINIQDLLNTIDVNLDSDIQTNCLQPYPNVSQVDFRNGQPVAEMSEESYSVYYHKKIRSEQVRYQRMTCIETEEDKFPSIVDVFSKFNGDMNRNVTQPLYVQVSDVPETLPNYTHASRSIVSAAMLETLYNFKNSHLSHTPLLQIITTSNTRCVYSTPVIVTAMAQHTTSLVASEPYNMPPYKPDNIDVDLPHLYDPMRHPEPEFIVRRMNSGDVSTAVSSLDTSQSQMGGSATIPEMVEDALEIISQDGDYMEHIGMDIRVQCVLCSWAGPKIILECHIRKEHPTQIHNLSKTECDMVYTLGSLVHSKLWINQVLEYEAELYVLSAKYESPDCLMATLSSLSSEPHPLDRKGTITIYSKVTGEPYVWEGCILPLPPNLPYENDLTCLSIPLSKLDLLPNSANLKLHNEELVLKSPSKVVVGQPEFNNIHVTIFVAIS